MGRWPGGAAIVGDARCARLWCSRGTVALEFEQRWTEYSRRTRVGSPGICGVLDARRRCNLKWPDSQDARSPPLQSSINLPALKVLRCSFAGVAVSYSPHEPRIQNPGPSLKSCVKISVDRARDLSCASRKAPRRFRSPAQVVPDCGWPMRPALRTPGVLGLGRLGGPEKGTACSGCLLPTMT